MHISDLERSDELQVNIIQYLRNAGVKHRIKKSSKKLQVCCLLSSYQCILKHISFYEYFGCVLGE